MTRVKLKHVDRFVDRHGRERHYFRRGHGARVLLPGMPGSEAFMLAYQAALAGQEICKAQRGDPGTFDRLVKDYFESPDFMRLGLSTQRAYRSVIERLVRDENIGHRPVREMGRVHVQKIVARRAATPGAANDVLKKLKILLHFAIDNGWRKDDPTLRIQRFAEGEFHTWTDDEIAVFEAVWPLAARSAAPSHCCFTRASVPVTWRGWTAPTLPRAASGWCSKRQRPSCWWPLHPNLQLALAGFDGRAKVRC